MISSRQDVLEAVKRGVDACRRGQWQIGMAALGQAVANETFREELPGVFYSYYGYGLARFEGRKREGLELCRHAVEVEFYRGENYVNLARAYLLSDHRGAAVKVVLRGLGVDPKNRELRRLYKELGARRQPLLSFLPRAHPLNRLLGRLRHRFFG